MSSEELYKKHRPQKLSDVIGQKDAIDAIVDMGKRGAIPHTILFTGPSGCGKTTLARIIRVKLKCSDEDYEELNASDCRGIDEIRGIRQRMGFAPMNGACRVILVDECHGLTSDAQEAFLKLLEDTPKHIYFFLCTTNPGKLKKTIITRSTEIKCKGLSESDIVELVKKIATVEGKTLDDAVISKLARASSIGDCCSARLALVLLHKIIGITNKDEQLSIIELGDVQTQGIDLCRLLMKGAQWGELAAVLSKLEEDAEAVRRIILGYAQAILLKAPNKRASDIIEEFRLPLYDIGKPGLVNGCFRLTGG